MRDVDNRHLRQYARLIEGVKDGSCAARAKGLELLGGDVREPAIVVQNKGAAEWFIWKNHLLRALHDGSCEKLVTGGKFARPQSEKERQETPIGIFACKDSAVGSGRWVTVGSVDTENGEVHSEAIRSRLGNLVDFFCNGNSEPFLERFSRQVDHLRRILPDKLPRRGGQ